MQPNPRETRTAMVQTRTLPSLRAALVAAAAAQDRSVSWVVEQALQAWLADQSRAKTSKGDVR